MIVPRARLEEVERLALDAVSSIVVGDPRSQHTTHGPVANRAQFNRVQEMIGIGIAEGARLLCGGLGRPEGLERGFYVRPTIFSAVHTQMKIAQEEIFGPVLSVLTFRTPDEAIEKANNTPYGLSAGVWTEKGSRILSMAQRLRAGVIWANTYNRFDPASPFGGYKESGFGREGGRHGLEPYMRFE
jgi:aldehyde dehydrogenase (NAD+)